MAIVYARVNPSSQQSEHIRVGVVFTTAWQSVDVDAPTRAALFADPFLQASDTDPGGSSGVTINENNPTKIRTYSALDKRPAASIFGVGISQIGKALQVSDGVSWSDISGSSKIYKIKPNLEILNSTPSAAAGVQMGVITIPGGDVTNNSIIRIEAIYGSSSALGTKATILRLGGIASTWAVSSTQFAGQGGLTTQRWMVNDARIIPVGGVSNQLIQPAFANSFGGANAAAPIAAAVDMSLDWSIYFGGSCDGTAGCSLILYSASVEIL